MDNPLVRRLPGEIYDDLIKKQIWGWPIFRLIQLDKTTTGTSNGPEFGKGIQLGFGTGHSKM